MIVVGLIGKIGSGKDTVADYLVKNYGFKMVGFGDVTRDIAKRKKVIPNRRNLLKIQRDYVEKYGEDYFPKKIIQMIKKKGFKKVVANGVRRPVDATTFKRSFGKDFLLVLVKSDSKRRFERMRKRARVGDPRGYREFDRQEKDEMRTFGIDRTFRMADVVITNNKTMKDLQKKVDKFISGLL
jgi:dephospho-CoA kinase